jgi:hypothetical protein
VQKLGHDAPGGYQDVWPIQLNDPPGLKTSSCMSANYAVVCQPPVLPEIDMNSKLARLSASGWIHLLYGIAVAVLAAGTALPVYAQASWSGQIQCQLTIQSDGYSHQEVQTWQLTTDPPTLNGAMPVYSANWSVTEQGATQRNLPTQALAGEWKASTTPTKVVFIIIKRASDQRLLVKRYTPAVYVPGAVVGVRRVAAPGAAAATSQFQLPAWEWPLPVIEDAGNSTDVSGSATTMIAASFRPMQPGGPSSPANCVWHFTYGTSAPSRAMVPPTVTASTPGLSTTQPTPDTGSSQTPATPPTAVETAKSRAPVAEKTAPPPPPPPKPPLTVTAATSPCNTAGPFSISANVREFLAGATTVDFGPDITVTSVTVDSDASITTQLFIPPSATPGPHTVTVKIGAKTFTAPAAFTVTSPCASSELDQLATVDPSFGWQNEQNLTAHVIRGQGSVQRPTNQGFVQGVTTADFGQGITVNSVNVISANKADVNISLSSNAQSGTRSVTLKTANQTSSPKFEVMRAGNTTLTLPTATTACNVIGSFIVKGPATHFVSGISQANFGPDITVLATTVQNPYQLTAQLYVPANANSGTHTVTVTTGGETASLASGFTVTNPCAATQENGDPLIAHETPASGVRGVQNMKVSFPGANFAQGVTLADFGDGITVNSVTVTTANHADVNINISSTALVGTHTVSLTTANNVLHTKFGVSAGGHLTLTMPTATAACNQVGSFEVYGNTANFASGVTVVNFGPDITVLDVTVSKSTSLTARVYIPPNATAGAHTVTATTGAEVASLASGFTVTSPCATRQMVAGGIVPDIGVIGVQNLVVHVGGTNLNLVQDLTTADFGPGITVNSVTVTNATSADVNISISPTAVQGYRDVTLTTANVVVSPRNSAGNAFYVAR